MKFIQLNDFQVFLHCIVSFIVTHSFSSSGIFVYLLNNTVSVKKLLADSDSCPCINLMLILNNNYLPEKGSFSEHQSTVYCLYIWFITKFNFLPLVPIQKGASWIVFLTFQDKRLSQNVRNETKPYKRPTKCNTQDKARNETH